MPEAEVYGHRPRRQELATKIEAHPSAVKMGAARKAGRDRESRLEEHEEEHDAKAHTGVPLDYGQKAGGDAAEDGEDEPMDPGEHGHHGEGHRRRLEPEPAPEEGSTQYRRSIEGRPATASTMRNQIATATAARRPAMIPSWYSD